MRRCSNDDEDHSNAVRINDPCRVAYTYVPEQLRYFGAEMLAAIVLVEACARSLVLPIIVTVVATAWLRSTITSKFTQSILHSLKKR